MNRNKSLGGLGKSAIHRLSSTLLHLHFNDVESSPTLKSIGGGPASRLPRTSQNRFTLDEWIKLISPPGTLGTRL